MNILTYSDKGRPMRRRLAGVAMTLLVDLIVWVLLIFVALGGGLRSDTFFAAAITAAFLGVGVFLGLYAKKQNKREFLQGVVIATSLVLLLEVTCSSWAGLILRG